MTTLARFSVGRILLHLLAMLGDRCVRFHVAGIMREIARVAATPVLLAQMRGRLIDGLVRYLAQPIKHCTVAATADPRSLSAILHRGDVLLSEGNTRVAALVKRITRSPWSHVSMYVGPLEDGPDPPCVVEADIAKGVRSIRLSELGALRVRVLRPSGLNDTDRCRLAAWVVSRIGSQYDLTHAWVLGRDLLRLPLSTRSRASPYMIANSTTSFICCSLLAHAFTLVGYSILPARMRVSLPAAAGHTNLTPGDFEHSSLFEVVPPMNTVV
jgi:Permuted papain-like amidase enzyme, YaeF/YiiX, C92 family